MSKLNDYVFNNLIALDQQINTLLCGSPDETLSSRAYRTEQNNKLFGKVFRPLIDFLFFWQKNHCLSAYQSEIYRKQLPSEYKKGTEDAR